MSHDNPWSDERGQNTNTNTNTYQGQSYPNHNPYSTYENSTSGSAPHANPLSSNPPEHGQYAPPDHPPPAQQQRYYQADPPMPQDHNDSNPWGSSTGHAPPSATSNSHQQQSYQPPSQPPYPSSEQDNPPNLPPRRTGTDLALPTGADRSHQIEVMQSYEAAGRKDDDDRNVEILQREFPSIDGSLIAAIYGDSKSLSATREMLGELS